MANPTKSDDFARRDNGRDDCRFALRFTPAEWRVVLEDADFLDVGDNSYRAPRRFMGVAVEIVPDHEFG